MAVEEQAALAAAKQKELQSFFDNSVRSYSRPTQPRP